MSTTPPPTAISNPARRPNEPSFPWLGAALTAATVTAALVVPGALYLRRKKLPIHSVAPRRQIASNMSLRSLPAVKAENNTILVRDIQKLPSPEETAAVNDKFSPALYSVRALAVATLLVSVGAGAGFWAVKTAMDVKDVHDFARKMRQIILTRMPILSSRIHRMVEDDENDDSIMDPSDWSWEDAERRMKDAYDKEGLLAWGEVAIKELQAEERAGRLKRKQLEDVAPRKV